MFFTERQLQHAARLKSQGLAWKPSVGHYIHDANHLLKPSSPFQQHVYFLLDIRCFIRAVGDATTLQKSMVWLPTWEHARQILRALNVPEPPVTNELKRDRQLTVSADLDVLYEFIESAICRPD